MTIPQLPDWTEAFARQLPQLSQQIAGIVQPQHQQEVMLRQAIQSDPRLLSVFATIAKDNPDAIGRLFGPKAGAFLSTLNETPEAQLARAKSGAGVSALSDPSVSRDAGLLSAVGQTDAQRRGQTANADTAEINADQAKVIQASLAHVKESNPELYDQLSQIGALKSYFGTDQNTETIKTNQAEEAKANIEARMRVNAILGQDPKKLYNAFQKGDVTVGDLGNAFEDPRSQGLKLFFDMQMRNEHDAFMLKKQADMQAAQDRRAALSQAGADERLAARLQAEQDKAAEAAKKVQERQIAYNNVNINKFLSMTQDKSGKRMSDEQIAASLPQVNELLQRNQIMKDLDPSTAPQFVAQKSGGFLGMGQRTTVQLLNPDGTPNAEYNKETKTTKTSGRQQTQSGGSSVPPAAPKGNAEVYNKLAEPTKKIVDTVREKNISRGDLVASKAYQALSTDEKNKVIQSLGF